MTISANNVKLKGAVFSTVISVPPVQGFYFVNDTTTTESSTAFYVERSSSDGTGQVDWAITSNQFNPATGIGAYADNSVNLMTPSGVLNDVASGIIPSGTASGSLASLNNAIDEVTAPLSALYSPDYTHYIINGDYILFVFSQPREISKIYFDASTSSDPVSCVFYTDYTSAPNDLILFEYPGTILEIGIDPAGNPRKIFGHTLMDMTDPENPVPTSVTAHAVLVSGVGGYPQGAPQRFYGLYDEFLYTTSGTAYFGNRDSLYEVPKVVYAGASSSATATVTLSNPVNGTVGIPGTATLTFNAPSNYRIAVSYEDTEEPINTWQYLSTYNNWATNHLTTEFGSGITVTVNKNYDPDWVALNVDFIDHDLIFDSRTAAGAGVILLPSFTRDSLSPGGNVYVANVAEFTILELPPGDSSVKLLVADDSSGQSYYKSDGSTSYDFEGDTYTFNTPFTIGDVIGAVIVDTVIPENVGDDTVTKLAWFKNGIYLGTRVVSWSRTAPSTFAVHMGDYFPPIPIG